MYKNFKIFYFIFPIIILFLASYYLNDFRIDASSDSLVAQNDDDFKYYNFYQNIFPTKNNLVIAIKSNDEIDNKFLDEVSLLSEQISKIPQVSSVFNINKAPILFLNKTSLLDLSNNKFETITDNNYEINAVLDEFANSPIYSDQIINKNKNLSSLIIFLRPNDKLEDLKQNKSKYLKDNTYYSKKSEIDKDREKLISKIKQLLNDRKTTYEYYLGGVEMISSDVISFVKNDIFVFSIIVLCLVLVILFFIFRKIKWVLTIILTSIFSTYVMFGLIGFLNFEITAVSSNFMSLMFILSVSMNIHILNNFLQTENDIIETIKTMFWPCFYTFLTTVVAFLSLVISDIKPVIDFGIVMIIALTVALITSFTILPLLISLFSKEKYQILLKFSIIEKFKIYSDKFKKRILFTNILFLFVSIYGLINLNVENSFIKYFKKNTDIYKGMKLIDSELGGTTPLDIILKFKDENLDNLNNNNSEIIEFEEEDIFEDEVDFDDLFTDTSNVWFTDEKIDTIKEIHKFLEKRNEIGKVISIYSLIDVANRINKEKISNFELSILYKEIPAQYKEDLVDPYLNVDKNMIKISARVKDSEDIKREVLIREISNYTNNSFNNIEEIKINGLLILYNNMLASLFESQIKSLGFVLVAIFFMFLILFRSLKLSIAGIIPNILASTFILGLIGLLKIPLDIMTITIAAISIGIAVDNTIHYLYRYKINTSNKLNYNQAIEKTHQNVGKAIMTTSLAISLGFLTLTLSNFVPTIIFGLFTSLAMLFALIGVLITLPSILYYLK